jgi:N-acetylglutamate synthase-like GNAT family acetyltransferase
MSDTTTRAPTIRPATPADLPSVERLLTTAHLPLDGVADALPTFTVADADGELVGVAGLELCCDNALLRSVAVAPTWQGRGLGRSLVHRVIADAEGRGIRALYLLTTTAEHYFPSLGFTTVARDAVPADVRGTAEFREACPASAVVMARPLPSAGAAPA